jgi:hypothetical protein
MSKPVDHAQGLAALFGITLGPIPLIKALTTGTTTLWLHWIPAADTKPWLYAIPALILALATAAITLLERRKQQH